MFCCCGGGNKQRGVRVGSSSRVTYTRGAGERKILWRGAQRISQLEHHSGTALCIDSFLHCTILRFYTLPTVLLHPGFVERDLMAETVISMIGALPRYRPVLFIYLRARLMRKRGKRVGKSHFNWLRCGPVWRAHIASARAHFPILHYRWGETV